MEKISKEINLKDKSENSDLAKIIEKNRIDFEIIHSYGSGMDEKALPHHISSQKEINEMIDKFEQFIGKYLLNISIKPSVVTIARSSLDDYCPTDQVNFIQDETLNVIKKSFGKYVNSVKSDY